MTNNVSVQHIVIVGCVCGIIVVVLCVVLAIIWCCRRRLVTKNKRKVNSVSTHSTSPISSQSTVDVDVSKAAVTSRVIDPGFDNPSIDLSSAVHTSTPNSDSQRKLVPILNNGHVVGFHENGALPLSVHWPQNGVSQGHLDGNDADRKYDMTRTMNGDSGYTGASPRHLTSPQSPPRNTGDGRSSFRTDAHGRPVKKVIHEVIV